MTVVRYHRATATNPGKHGPKDWRVDFLGSTPTIGELLFMLGMYLVAEDRYDTPGTDGRYQLWYFADRLLDKKTPEGVVSVAEDAQETVSDRTHLQRRKNGAPT